MVIFQFTWWHGTELYHSMYIFDYTGVWLDYFMCGKPTPIPPDRVKMLLHPDFQ